MEMSKVLFGTYGGRRVYYSTRRNKKFMVNVDGSTWVHFGHPAYEDYLEHRDKERRKNYLARSGKIKNRQGKLTKDDPYSPNYWSRRVLWKSREKY